MCCQKNNEMYDNKLNIPKYLITLTTPIEDAVTPFPIPDNTPPVTTTILRSESSVS